MPCSRSPVAKLMADFFGIYQLYYSYYCPTALIAAAIWLLLVLIWSWYSDRYSSNDLLLGGAYYIMQFDLAMTFQLS